jgi:hypothetical protein
MNPEIEPLLSQLKKLSDSLKNSKNQGPAKFIDDLSEKLRSADTTDKLSPLLKELIRSTAITQYGDFSSTEEAMLHKAQKLAIPFLQ